MILIHLHENRNQNNFHRTMFFFYLELILDASEVQYSLNLNDAIYIWDQDTSMAWVPHTYATFQVHIQ